MLAVTVCSAVCQPLSDPFVGSGQSTGPETAPKSRMGGCTGLLSRARGAGAAVRSHWPPSAGNTARKRGLSRASSIYWLNKKQVICVGNKASHGYYRHCTSSTPPPIPVFVYTLWPSLQLTSLAISGVSQGQSRPPPPNSSPSSGTQFKQNLSENPARAGGSGKRAKRLCGRRQPWGNLEYVVKS